MKTIIFVALVAACGYAYGVSELYGHISAQIETALTIR